MEKDIGSLEPGKRTDLIILDMDQPHLIPCHHIPSTLVYQAKGTEVESVMVNGEWLTKDKLPQFLNEASEMKQLMENLQNASLRVIQNAGMDHLAN